ncbi:MAG: bacteriohemerythrin [Campylobacterales bacterium]|nr:bacteriohemerythrin [Campylobacterales bacterium]
MNSIDIFPWNEHFNTGIEAIDTQHRQLVVLLNRLATLVAYQASKEELNAIFDELIDYTVYHFQTEEAIWHRYLKQDSLEREHQAVHQTFVDTVVRLGQERLSKPIVALADETLEFLARWLASHILETDRYMAQVVLALQQGLEFDVATTYAKEQMSGSSRILIEIILSIYATLSTNTVRLMRELQSHAYYEQKASYQERYEGLLLALSTAFVNCPLDQIDAAIDNALAQMSAFVGADRAYVFDYDFEVQTTSNTYEWCAEGITPQIETLQQIPLAQIPDWPQKHAAGEHIVIQDVAALPEGGLKEILRSQQIQSLVSFPIFEQATCKGFVGFDAVKTHHIFSEYEITLLKLFSALLANVADRRRTEAALIHERIFLKTLIQSIPDLVWMKDPEGVYLICNRRFEDFFGAKEAQIVGKTDEDFVEPALADFFRAHDRTVMHSGSPSVNEEEIPFAVDGHKETLHTTKVPVYDSNGTLLGVLGVGRDITELKKAQERLRLAASVFSHTREAILITSADNRIIDANEAVERITGYTRDELIGKNPKILGSGQNSPSFYQEMWHKLSTEGYWNGEIWNRRKSGETYVELMTITAVKDDHDQLLRYVALFSDITPMKEQQKRLEYIAHHDALTGLPNRVLLLDRLQQAMVRTHRNRSTLAVAYLDLDGFKEINDTHGHDSGDTMLRIIADRMTQTLREEDTIARLGGDEFVVVLLDFDTHDDCVPLLNRLLHAASEVISLNGIAMRVTASLGVTFFDPEDVINADQLLRQADQAMYQAKLLGKNRFHIFDAAHDLTIRSHHEQLEAIEQALTQQEFVLYYQPKVNMHSGNVIGAEALIRWNHPQKGILPPGAFLPITENHPLSIKIGAWVLEEAFKQIAQWKADALHLVVSINISAIHLLKGDMVATLQSLLAKYPSVEPCDFMLEILETSALEELSRVIEIMQACNALGVAFALDDFGTGYSSLTYLKRLRASELKIDRSFVHDMLIDADDLAILDGIISLARAFELEVVAEGVEEIAQGEILIQMGCERAQGYAIARPMPAASVSEWISTWKPDIKWIESYRRSR